MRKLIRSGALSVSLASMIATGALAQTPPSALSAVPGLAYEGQIGGMDVWSVPGVPDLFAVTPDGRTLMRGAIFSGAGRDIGSALTGSAPSDLLGGAPVAASVVSVPGPDSPPLMVNTAPERGFSALLGPDTCQSPVMAELAPALAPRVGGWDEAGRGAPPSGNVPVVSPGEPLASVPVIASEETGLMDGAAIAREAQDALAGFDQTEKRELLLGLVADLRDAQTREQFLGAIASWRAEIDRTRSERGLPRLYSEDGTTPLPPVPVGSPSPATLAPTPIETTILPPAASEGVTRAGGAVEIAQEARADVPLEQALLEDVRYNALWFSVGANDAPSVYAFIDPTCSYSARAISALSAQVGAGELQLRVILAPVLSQRSAGLIAGILTSDQPPLTFFDHEVGLAERGRSELEPAEFSALPAPVQAGIQRNFEMIRDYGIPGVPFFVYETAEGARVLSGAPDGISFPDALVDPYTGTK